MTQPIELIQIKKDDTKVQFGVVRKANELLTSQF